MTANLSSLLAVVALAGIVSLCLLGISHVRSPAIHERGHMLFSFLPWLHHDALLGALDGRLRARHRGHGRRAAGRPMGILELGLGLSP